MDNLSPWNGEERRKMSSFDMEIHKKIIETHADVKNLVKNFDSHVILDEKSFASFSKSIDSLKEFRWKSVGAVVVLLVAIDIVIKVLLK